MRVVDYSFRFPALNLALDEALLNGVERGGAPETLRFWESPTHFVVVGTAQALREEVHEDHCRADGVPVLRRCSAGGCVLQGPGCLNFALALRTESRPEIASLHASYDYILGALIRAFARRGLHLSAAGVSDLVQGDRKVSGNAQRRRRRAILHHGTLLYRVEAGRMDRYLKEPSRRPAYRGARTHGQFLAALPLPPAALRAVVCEAFGATVGDAGAELLDSERDECEELARSKYRTDAWTYRR